MSSTREKLSAIQVSFPKHCPDMATFKSFLAETDKIRETVLTALLKLLNADETLEVKITLALIEIVNNVIYHDLINLVGEEVPEFKENFGSEDLPEEFATRIKEAEGKSTSVFICAEEKANKFVITVTMTLLRDFPNFKEIWKKANPAIEPTEEEIFQTHGRGWKMIRMFFKKASYNPETKMITLRKTIKKIA